MRGPLLDAVLSLFVSWSRRRGRPDLFPGQRREDSVSHLRTQDPPLDDAIPPALPQRPLELPLSLHCSVSRYDVSGEVLAIPGSSDPRPCDLPRPVCGPKIPSLVPHP